MTKPKYGPYEFMIRYDPTERKLIFVVNGEKHVWDIAELDAKEAAHTADLGTRYRYRQEGAEAERQRIVRLLIDKAIESRLSRRDDEADVFDFAVAIITAEQK